LLQSTTFNGYMILIYSNKTSTRLQYICKFIFKEQLGLAYSITEDRDGFSNHEGIKINYSTQSFTGSLFNIPPHSLLFETGIQPQSIQCFEFKNHKAFFKNIQGDFAFDIFAACFYLLSRYEEYLPHEKDMYGRYAYENSLAWKEGFLKLPLVNIWLHDFAISLQEKFPGIDIQFPAAGFVPTYDIDIAWSYKYKGLIRNIGGFIKSPTLNRLSVLFGLQKDPYYSYQYMDELHAANNLSPVYFFLVATWNSVYDKNISPYSHAMWKLIRQHAKKYSIGLHPSWKSNEKDPVLKREKKILETASGAPILKSRQHYIKFTLPQTFQKLADTGIEDDYSMGYGSINGFRASVASGFQWYNLQTETISKLRLHPFCFMDANSFYEQHFTAEQAYEELLHYYDLCKKYHGTFISIFHNNFLGTDKTFAGWKEMYSRFISQLPR